MRRRPRRGRSPTCIDGADIFLGLSAADRAQARAASRSMAAKPLILALANPTPEIMPELARAARPDAMICTGRSDYPEPGQQRPVLSLYLPRRARWGQFLGGLFGLALPLLALGGQGEKRSLRGCATHPWRISASTCLTSELASYSAHLRQLVHAVRRGVVRRAHRLQLGFHIRRSWAGLGFQVDLGLLNGARMALLFGLGLALAQQPQQVLLFLAVGLQRLEALEPPRPGLPACRGWRRVRAGCLPRGSRFSRVSPRRFSVSRRRSLCPEHAAASSRKIRMSSGLASLMIRERPLALPDDGVGARPEAGAQEDVLDVAPAHRAVVDVVRGGAVAGRRRDSGGRFGVLAPLAGGAAFGVVEDQFHAGAPVPACARWRAPLRMTSYMDSPRSSGRA